MPVTPENYFADELRRHQDAETAADLRAERIEERARHLLTTDEYNPFSAENFAEAMAQINDADMRVIAACVAEAVNQNLEVALTNHLALCAIKRAVEQYWLGVARYIAEKEASRGWNA